MPFNSQGFSFQKRRLFWFAAWGIILWQGCTVKFVADYNAEVAKQIIEVSKQVDSFYGYLLETAYLNRSYEAFKDEYIEIEVNIRALVVLNKARPLNDESIAIAETILDKWIKYKEMHKTNWDKFQNPVDESETMDAKDIYKDTLAKNHRKRFTRLFTAMSVAEEAKKLNSEPDINEGDE